MTALYEYRVEFDDGRDAEIVETTLPPGGAFGGDEGELWPSHVRDAFIDEYPDAARFVYVGRVA